MASTDEVLALLDQPIDGAAVGAALELGLFWLLEPEPLHATAIGKALGISETRCIAWLRFLRSIGFLEESQSLWRPSQTARDSILGGYSAATWRLLAEEARERLETISDMARALRSVPDAAPTTAGYVERMAADLDRARRFTRMLLEIHRGLADEVAAALELTGVSRLMDLGGGSGVVAMALVRRWPDLSVTVVDIANVCVAGREVVAEAGLGDRIDFHAANFTQDPLPGGFDAVLECDVAVYSEPLFGHVRDALVPGGRFLVVDEFEPEEGVSDRARLGWRVVRTLTDPSWTPKTVARTRDLLVRAGFVDFAESKLAEQPGVGGRRAGTTVLECRVPSR
ncbi:MAG: methyltransferase [Candidatus Limnocylindrales bacterium]